MAGQRLLRRPVPADAQALDPEVGGELHIRIAVADHVAARGIERMGLEVRLQQPELGFAAGAVLVLEMRTDEHGVEVDALRGE